MKTNINFHVSPRLNADKTHTPKHLFASLFARFANTTSGVSSGDRNETRQHSRRIQQGVFYRDAHCPLWNKSRCNNRGHHNSRNSDVQSHCDKTRCDPACLGISPTMIDFLDIDRHVLLPRRNTYRGMQYLHTKPISRTRFRCLENVPTPQVPS